MPATLPKEKTSTGYHRTLLLKLPDCQDRMWASRMKRSEERIDRIHILDHHPFEGHARSVYDRPLNKLILLVSLASH